MKNAIYPCLWFNNNGKEAAQFYCTAFENAHITSDAGIVVTFEVAGQQFMCLNGGPHFTINPSISFFVVCTTEAETDKLWKTFASGGKVLMPLDKYPWSEKYGWVQDKFGISWQLSFGKLEDVGQKITPTLMFTGLQSGKAAEAIEFYTSVFDNSTIRGILKYTAEDNDVEGFVKHAQFTLDKSVLMAMDSSAQHGFKFNEGISLVVNCETQKEIDYYWSKLTEGGEESNCGWLKDKYGISWQIVPSILGKLMSNPEKSSKVMQAFMKMKKFDIEKLENA